ncbi:MAG: leucyl/phenylalanyl-tRNA--protein transferase [Clostridia bacterium]|nr:leucyl/phenylalanyl-tRNA--protein transferase [Clostridia bacterium]
MPVYRLTKELVFPHPGLANKDGLLAVGGDLSVERLLLAYSNGIFPWFSEEDPILWWSPDPRCVLFPKEIKISKSMEKFLKKGLYKVTFDRAFSSVIGMCRELREGDTWLTDEMVAAYTRLYSLGFAHSVEVWFQDHLVGGLYGVSLGKCFFGESMFSTKDNASKTALIAISKALEEHGFLLIDCQVYSKHLESMGAVNIARKEFLEYVKNGLTKETMRGSWSFLEQ